LANVCVKKQAVVKAQTTDRYGRIVAPEIRKFFWPLRLPAYFAATD
jgi:hypothetical protein